MSKIKKYIWFSVLLFAVTIVAVMKRDAYADVAYHPQRINIGYCQVGGYYEFDYMLYEIGTAMLETGDIESEKLSEMSLGDSADDVWDALSSSKSDYYSFKKEAFYDRMYANTNYCICPYIDNNYYLDLIQFYFYTL